MASGITNNPNKVPPIGQSKSLHFLNSIVESLYEETEKLGPKLGGWPPLNSENVFGWPILAGLFHARVGVFLLSFFQFLSSIFWQLRAELAGGEAVEGLEAANQFGAG